MSSSTSQLGRGRGKREREREREREIESGWSCVVVISPPLSVGRLRQELSRSSQENLTRLGAAETRLETQLADMEQRHLQEKTKVSLFT